MKVSFPNFCAKLFIFSVFSLYSASSIANDLKVYTGFHIFNGIYNVREVNSPTDRMPGFHLFSGASFPIIDYLSFRVEGMYNHGYDHSPSTNYSSFTIRSGFEVVNSDGYENSAIIPYFLLGAGIVAYDPPKMDMQEGYVTSGTFGVKVPFGSGWNIDIALEYSYSTFDFVLVKGKTHLDRMGLGLGIVKTF